MELVNTRRLFLAIERDAQRAVWLRWGFWRWQGAITRNPTDCTFARFGGDGDYFVHVGPVVFMFTGLCDCEDGADGIR